MCVLIVMILELGFVVDRCMIENVVGFRLVVLFR